ncbi:hypothetical protein EVAR_94889_1 [Eumeta japonica]|uniref:Uncharacterized protein n=1 Tax=Eumeta variegata TaxID=151549 RepID=A0A4C1V990_EUMVA|nr:hypothetical protein EVAR_94889_1 [Eumeta japonica]
MEGSSPTPNPGDIPSWPFFKIHPGLEIGPRNASKSILGTYEIHSAGSPHALPKQHHGSPFDIVFKGSRDIQKKVSLAAPIISKSAANIDFPGEKPCWFSDISRNLRGALQYDPLKNFV